MVLVLVASFAVWWHGHDPLPDRLRIATAEPGGLYHRFGAAFATELGKRTGRDVELVPSHGSVDNLGLLERGEVELVVLQATAVELRRVAVVAPLYPEVVHVIVRAGVPASSLVDLIGRKVSLGLPGSGMRESARRILAHYEIGTEEIAEANHYFMDLESGEVDAAIVTTGLDNPDLHRLLASGDYALVPILDGRAINLRERLFAPFSIPRGFHGERPPLPPEDLSTVATSSVLAARPGCSERLVRAALDALYSDQVRTVFPMMFAGREALKVAPAPLHPSARAYLDPYGGIDVLSQTIEALSGAKELLFGLGALGYLIWDLARSAQRRRHEREIRVQQERLDDYLNRTVAIERAQMTTTDLEELEGFLDRVTELKLEALEELTHEDLRGDRNFLIFLTQCANLIRKIQTKILIARARFGEDRPAT